MIKAGVPWQVFPRREDCRGKRTKRLFAVQLWKLRNLIELIKAKVGHCLKLSIRETFQQSPTLSPRRGWRGGRRGWSGRESCPGDYFPEILSCWLWVWCVASDKRELLISPAAGGYCQYRLLNYKSRSYVKISLSADGRCAPHVPYNEDWSDGNQTKSTRN